MSKQTPGQISKATGISRFTISNAAKRGEFPATLAGDDRVHPYYLIDTETPEFKEWLSRHGERTRPNAGRKKKASSPSEHLRKTREAFGDGDVFHAYMVEMKEALEAMMTEENNKKIP